MGISQDLKSNSLTFAGHNMQIMMLEIHWDITKNLEMIQFFGIIEISRLIYE